jgi:hypothetical protein
MPIPANHISLVAMWGYRAGKVQFSNDDLQHLCLCNECLSLLGICQLSKSVEEVERRQKEIAAGGDSSTSSYIAIRKATNSSGQMTS